MEYKFFDLNKINIIEAQEFKMVDFETVQPLKIENYTGP